MVTVCGAGLQTSASHVMVTSPADGHIPPGPQATEATVAPSWSSAGSARSSEETMNGGGVSGKLMLAMSSHPARRTRSGPTQRTGASGRGAMHRV